LSLEVGCDRGVAALSRDVLSVAGSRVGTDSFGSVRRSICAHALALTD
jgi:hypothetical protein